MEIYSLSMVFIQLFFHLNVFYEHFLFFQTDTMNLISCGLKHYAISIFSDFSQIFFVKFHLKKFTLKTEF